MNKTYTTLAKPAILLVLAVGLILFLDQFSPILPFEPESTGWKLWFSYANDLILPFAFYFFLWLGERWLKTWQSRALLAFAIPTLIELGQAVYPWISGSRFFADRFIGAFDPFDILMYAMGVGLAVMAEQKLFTKLLTIWQR